MAVSFIKKLKQTKLEPIKMLLHENLAGMQKARPINVIHASSLTKEKPKFCPRAWAIMDDVGKTPKAEFISTSLQVTFDHGKDMQKRLNEEYLVDVMYGDWRCKACNAVREFSLKPETTCDVECVWEYEEVRVKSDTCGASGGVDALVDVGRPKLLLSEIKTMVKDDFKKLMAPIAEHRLRTNLYLRLVNESSQPWAKKVNPDVGSILYMVKGYGAKCEKIKEWGISDAGFSPYKEFEVKRDDSKTDHLMSASKALYQYRIGNSGMPCGICANTMQDQAKNCPVKKECFSGKFKLETTWLKPDGNPMHKGKKCVGV